MRYQEFKSYYNNKRQIKFSKFQKTLFQVQSLLNTVYDEALENKFINLIERNDLNKVQTLISALDIYKSLFVKSQTNNYSIAS